MGSLPYRIIIILLYVFHNDAPVGFASYHLVDAPDNVSSEADYMREMWDEYSVMIFTYR